VLRTREQEKCLKQRESREQGRQGVHEEEGENLADRSDRRARRSACLLAFNSISAARVALTSARSVFS